MKFLAVLYLLVLPGALAAQTIYKCAGAHGVQVFSQVPCGVEAEEVQLRVAEPTEADRTAAAQRLARPGVVALDGDERVCLDRAHRTAHDSPSRQLRAYRQRLAALERRARYTNNNLAGATLEAGLREEIAGIHQAMATIQMSAEQAYQAGAQRCRDQRARRERQSKDADDALSDSKE